MRTIVTVLVVGVAAISSAAASDMTTHPGHVVAPGFFGDQKGCYWRRGQRSCSRYCYWEADGRRYCQDHERTAHPQGDPWFVPFPPEPPIYLRPPARRP